MVDNILKLIMVGSMSYAVYLTVASIIDTVKYFWKLINK